MKNKFFLVLALPLLFFLSSCFEIIHYIEKDKDGMRISWMFTVSKGILKSDPNKAGEIFEKLDKAETEVSEKFKGMVKDLKVSKIDNEFDTGVSMNFSVKDLTVLQKKPKNYDENFPVLPYYDAAQNKLIFTFLPDNKEKKESKGVMNHPEAKIQLANYTGEGNESPENGTSENGATDPNADPMKGMEGMEEIMNMIFSSASYKLMFSGDLKIKSAELVGLESKTKYTVPVSKLGSIYMVKIPFASMMLKEKKGFNVIISL